MDPLSGLLVRWGEGEGRGSGGGVGGGGVVKGFSDFCAQNRV